MISYATYKLVHYLGIFALVASLSAALARSFAHDHAAASSTDRGDARPDPIGRRLAAAHGAAAFLILLGGFGMLARLQITSGLSLPGWIWAKLGIWTLLALALSARRHPGLARVALIAAPLLAALAATVAVYKPF